MSDLCERLQDVQESGVYQLGCPVEVLRGNVALSELRFFEVSLSECHGKGEFLAAVAKAIQAPDWFGHNWDALADALGDLSWLDADDKESEGYVLLLQGADATLGLTQSDYDTAMNIFSETSKYWKSEGKPFWIFYA